MLTLNIKLDEIYEITGNTTVKMILFHGSAHGPYFSGTILPGGVDTQRSVPEGMMLSARYMLSGTAADGTAAKLFIENEGIASEGKELITHPVIVTDNPSLSWMEKADLTGRIHNDDDGLVITITKKNVCC